MAEEKQQLTGGLAGRSLVEVNPKPSKGLVSKATDLFEKLFVKLMYDSSKPQHYLSGNFAPVHDETPPVIDLPVKGYLPECLNGEFVRVGPNPKFSPVAGYHWFDGDGYVAFYFLVHPIISAYLKITFVHVSGCRLISPSEQCSRCDGFSN